MEWFRFYAEVLDDPKVQRLRPEVFRHWVNCLALASLSAERGQLPSVEDIAFRLRLSEAEAEQVIQELVGAGLIDQRDGTYVMHGWGKRQRASDSSTKRVQQHRAREAQPQEPQPSKPPVAPAPKPPAYPPAFEEFWKAYPSGHGVKKQAFEQWQRIKPDAETRAAIMTGLAAWNACDRWKRGYVKDAQRWLRDRQWEDEPPPADEPAPVPVRPIRGRDIGYTTDELIRMGNGDAP